MKPSDHVSGADNPSNRRTFRGREKVQYLSCGRRALGIEGWGNASREAEGDDAESVLLKRSSDAEETERGGEQRAE